MLNKITSVVNEVIRIGGKSDSLGSVQDIKIWL